MLDWPGLDWIGFTSGYRVSTALRIEKEKVTIRSYENSVGGKGISFPLLLTFAVVEEFSSISRVFVVVVLCAVSWHFL